MKNVANQLLFAAIFVGVVTELLFKDSVFNAAPWGLNVALWTGALTLTVSVIVRSHRKNRSLSLAMLAPALLCSMGLAWRDATLLNLLDFSLICFSLLWMSASVKGLSLRLAGVADYLLCGLAGIADVVAAAFTLPKQVDWGFLMPHKWRPYLPALIRGLLIASPLVLIFGCLLTGADPAFGHIVSNSLHIDVGAAFQTSMTVGVSTWMVAGLLCGLMHNSLAGSTALNHSVAPATVAAMDTTTADWQHDYPDGALGDPANSSAAGARKRVLALGVLEVGLVLGLLDLLFLSFVLVQFKYFFGGADVVQITSGLSYAQYARRGFFELVTVSGLVLPLLLTLDWLFVRSSKRDDIIVRVLAGSQIVLLIVIMISAVQRMLIYQSEYGLTELRVYTTAFMGWLAIVYVAYAATVLRGHRARFAWLSMLAGLVMTAGLHVSNPDALILGVNLQRLKEGKTFDMSYASTLSNDAVPVLMANLDSLPPSVQKIVAGEFLKVYKAAPKTDLRGWNWSHAAAYQAISSNRAKLERMAAMSPKDELQTREVVKR